MASRIIAVLYFTSCFAAYGCQDRAPVGSRGHPPTTNDTEENSNNSAWNNSTAPDASVDAASTPDTTRPSDATSNPDAYRVVRLTQDLPTLHEEYIGRISRPFISDEGKVAWGVSAEFFLEPRGHETGTTDRDQPLVRNGSNYFHTPRDAEGHLDNSQVDAPDGAAYLADLTTGEVVRLDHSALRDASPDIDQVWWSDLAMSQDGRWFVVPVYEIYPEHGVGQSADVELFMIPVGDAAGYIHVAGGYGGIGGGGGIRRGASNSKRLRSICVLRSAHASS
jgi:hypothetical protein